MTRDEFTAGFCQRLRNVIQKERRIAELRHTVLGSRVGVPPMHETNLDAVILELAEYVYDGLEAAGLVSIR